MSTQMEDYDWIEFDAFISSLEKGDEIYIWSDGGCNPNPGPGGWGAILAKGDTRTILTGGGLDTTNNRMELIAALSSLDSLPKGCVVTLHSDSQYVIKGISQWMYGWKKKHWLKKDGSDIVNVDLWKEIYDVVRKHDVECIWVKGHNGHAENELCDQLATESRRCIEDSEDDTSAPIPRTSKKSLRSLSEAPRRKFTRRSFRRSK